jgi:hypothetical protein
LRTSGEYLYPPSVDNPSVQKSALAKAANRNVGRGRVKPHEESPMRGNLIAGPLMNLFVGLRTCEVRH